MGDSRWSSSDWDSFTTTSTSGKSRAEIFDRDTIDKSLDPVKMEFREARDSKSNPNSTPIIVALDVTGSMGEIPEYMVREGLKTLVEEIHKRKSVVDPQVMFMGVGDAKFDSAPLQVTQFEADIKAAEQLKNIYLEGGGGNNRHESYNMPWYFAAMKTKLDCVEKGRRKGLLFTIGDEEAPPELRADQIKRFIGDDVPENMSSKDILAKAEQMYDVFHVVVEQGSYCRHARPEVMKSWNSLLGQGRVIPLADFTKLPEVIISAIEVHEGRSAPDVAKSWSGSTSVVVASAVKDLAVKGRTRPPANVNKDGGVVRFTA